MINPHGDWCVQAVNLVQGLIGCAYGFVPIETITATAAGLGPPPRPYDEVFIRGVVFGCLTRKMQTLSTSERALLTELVEEMGRRAGPDIQKAVRNLRTLLGIHGVELAEQIRDIIDKRYASKLTVSIIASELKVSGRLARAEFERRFDATINDYLTRRRVEEGVQMIRAGAKVEAAALSVGYLGKRHFYAAVRRLTGTTPKRLGRGSLPPASAVC